MSKAVARYREERDDGDGATFSITGGKWTILVVDRLGARKMRFNELRRELAGVSQKTLTSTLRALERDGFVLRTLFPTIPPRVEYELTPPGVELLQLASAWRAFTVRHRTYVEASRQQFDRATVEETHTSLTLVGRWVR